MADGFGDVYVYNIYAENIIKFNLNNQGSAGAVVSPGQKPPYAPHSLAVSRTALPKENVNSPLFVQGANQFTVDYPGLNWTGTANIDPTRAPAVGFDMWLYVAYRMAYLLDTQGSFFQAIYSEKTTLLTGRGAEVVLLGPPEGVTPGLAGFLSIT